jgi:hypothetical protein
MLAEMVLRMAAEANERRAWMSTTTELRVASGDRRAWAAESRVPVGEEALSIAEWHFPRGEMRGLGAEPRDPRREVEFDLLAGTLTTAIDRVVRAGRARTRQERVAGPRGTPGARRGDPANHREAEATNDEPLT